MIMGLRAGLSALAGSVLGWAVLGPAARHLGWAPGPVTDWRTGAQGWILWVALVIMLAEAAVALAITAARVLASYYRSYAGTANTAVVDPAPEREQVPFAWWAGGLAASVSLCIAIDTPLFAMPAQQVLLAVALGMVVSGVAVRALGDTDLNPVSGIGKVSQVVFGLVDSDAMVANIIGGGIAEAGAQQAGDMMQDLKTGHLLGGSPRAQFLAQLIGSGVSIVAAVAAYELYKHAYDIPATTKPPAAEIWLSMARLMKDGGESLAPHVAPFCLVFGAIGGLMPLVHELRPAWGPYLPSMTAVAIGMYIQVRSAAQRMMPLFFSVITNVTPRSRIG
jgi:OPT family oligopeptide transporter